MTHRRLAALALVLAAGPAAGQQVLRDGFGGPNPVWVKGEADARHALAAHAITDTFAHSPPSSEYFRLTAELGERVLFDYPTPRVPLGDETAVSVWVRATRPGVQLRARLVLPHEHSPAKLDEPLTTTLAGDRYTLTGRWQKLQLDRPGKLVKQQQSLLAAELRRPVDFRDAYIDRVMLNLYTGPGEAEVWVDDLEVGPLPPEQPGAAPQPDRVGKPAAPGGEWRAPAGDQAPARPVRGVVELNRDRLLVSGKPFFPRVVRDVGTPPEVLFQAGFNAVHLAADAPPEAVNKFADANLWLVPEVPELPRNPAARLTGRAADGSLAADLVGRHVSRFPASDAVLFWDLGGGRAYEQREAVARTASLVRAADPQRPLTADVWDGLWPYSRNLDLVGIHRFPLMTTLELGAYRDWLNQRRTLARPGTFVWTWVQAHAPEWSAELLHDRPAGTAPGPDDGPEPDQVQLLTYTALSAGCRGVGFWPDKRLADSQHGRERLLTLALLNQELQMLEPLLLGVTETPAWVPAYRVNNTGKKAVVPEVQAAVMRGEKGILVTPVWVGSGAQYVPGQAAAANIAITVPQVPPTATAWKVSPGEVRALSCKREAGGVTVTVPEFGLAAAIVFTSDTNLVVKWQDHARRTVRTAARWARDLAEANIERVERVQRSLEAASSPPQPDAAGLIADARRRAEASRRAFDQQDYRLAYLEAQRSLRPARILMRAHWDEAMRTVDGPAATAYAASFASLPRHWELYREVRSKSPAPDALAGGDFEVNPVPGERKRPLGEAQREREEEIYGPKPGPRDKPKRQPLPPGAARGQAPEEDPRIAPVPLGTGAAGGPAAGGEDDYVGNPSRTEPVPLSVRPVPSGWRVDQTTLDQVVMQARVVNVLPSEGKGCLELKVEPKEEKTPGGKLVPPPVALERTFLAVTSPEARLPPGTLVRISAWYRVLKAVTASADGAMIIDSVGGEPLATRFGGATKGWQKVSVYRRVPATGRVSVTLALTGLGTVYFDDVRIEPLQ